MTQQSYGAPPAGTYIPVTTDDIKPPSKVRPIVGAAIIIALGAVVGFVRASSDVSHYSAGVYLTYPLAFAFIASWFAIPVAAFVYFMSWSMYRGRLGARGLREASRQADVAISMDDQARYAALQEQRDYWIAQIVAAQAAGDTARANAILAQAQRAGFTIDEFALKEYVGRQYRSGAWRDAS